MRMPALVAVDAPAEAFVEFFRALREAGLRCGWLELQAPSVVPPELEEAAVEGVLRAVAVGDGRSVAVKPLAGPPVLRDLVREHFLGCTVVLVHGHAGFPRLAPGGERWRLRSGETAERELSLDGLVGELCRPRWRASEDAR